MQQRDTLNTIVTAGVLCLVCSLVVSVAAVGLRSRQDANKKLDQQKNILDAAGLAMSEFGRPSKELSTEQIASLYERVSEKMINLEDGTYNEEVDADKWDLSESIGKEDLRDAISNPTYNLGEEYRPKAMKVYFVKRPGTEEIRQVVLPIYGKGLWGSLYGYLAVKNDLSTVQGITFYEHKETPGLGGEVDNNKWKQSWEGLKLYDDAGQPAALVFKGPAPPNNDHAVDGLSGATITSRGVTNLVRYWASEEGYGPFLERLKQEISDTGKKAAQFTPFDQNPFDPNAVDQNLHSGASRISVAKG